MNVIKINALILFISTVVNLLVATDLENIKFERYGTDEGLASLVVYDIIQDSKGFIWLGTGNGVSRFDGYEFKNYQPDKDDPYSIGSGPAIDVYLDSKGRIWISVISSGLYMYDQYADNFIHYKNDPDNNNSLSSNNVYSIAEDKDGYFWVSTLDKGINRIDVNENTFTSFRSDPEDPNSLISDRVGSILIDRDNILWISTVTGTMSRYDIKNDNFTLELDNISQCVSLTEDSNGDIWMPTVGHGVFRYNKKNEDFTQYNYDENSPGSISHKTTIRVLEDKKSRIWVATWGGGLNLFNPQDETFTSYKKQSGDSSSISSNDVWALFEDRTGVLWAGTYGGGINRYDSKDERFSIIQNSPNNPHSLSHNNVKAVFEDSFGYLWVGTLGGGLNRYNSQSDKYKKYTTRINDVTSISNNSIWMIAEDDNSDLWIATEAGLNRYNRETDDFTQFFTDEIIRSVFVDSKKNVWVGTHFNGIKRYSHDTKLFIQYPVMEANNATIFEDSSGVIWHGSIAGVYKYDDKNQSFSLAMKDPDNSDSDVILLVTDIKEDDNGNLWIGTINKLVRKDKTTGKLTFYTTKEGLIDDAISSLLVDDNGVLWISTSKGLSIYSESDDSFKNYEIGPFNRSSSFKTDDGELYFGAYDGLVHFFPDDIKDNLIPPPVVITSFKVFNKEIQNLGSVTELDFIELQYEDDFFSFDFSALDFSNPSKNLYKYKLEGFDQNWVEVSSKRRFASYTNLDSGDYIFRVIAANSDGIWNKEGHFIDIHIIPPFRDTFLFRVLVLLLFWSIVFVILYYIYKLNRALEKQKESEHEILKLKRYQTEILDSMPSLIAGIDSLGNVTLWNRTAVESTSIRTDEAKGKKLDTLLPEYNLNMEKIVKAIKTGVLITDLNTKVESDEPYYIDVTVYPLQEVDVDGAVVRIDDVTKKHQLMEKVHQSSKMDAIGHLAGGMAHDFNNMLAGIINASHLLKSPKRELDNKSKKYVDMIMKASVRASDLTSKLLTFSRKGEISYSQLNIHDLIDESVEILSRTIDKKINIIVDKRAKYFEIVGNSTGLQNILLNLGINSSHAMPDGGEIKIITRDITLSESYCNTARFEITPGKYCDIEVRDNGHGISKEIINKIFDPFFTTKKTGEGTGLGLSVTYGTVIDHHGAINVYSEEGVGSSFHIKLPISSRYKDVGENVENIKYSSGTVLLVDDEELIVVTCKEMLEEIGYKVIVARDGAEALDLYKSAKYNFDVVITDMIMPVSSGKDIFFKLKEINKDCKIVLSSGFTMDEDLKKLKDAGLSGFIQKPYQISELSHLLSEILK